MCLGKAFLAVSILCSCKVSSLGKKSQYGLFTSLTKKVMKVHESDEEITENQSEVEIEIFQE